MTQLEELELELLRFCSAQQSVLRGMINSPLNGEIIKERCNGGIIALDSMHNIIVEQFKLTREKQKD